MPRIRSTAEGRFGPGSHHDSSVQEAQAGRQGEAARDLALLREAVCGLKERAPGLSAAAPLPFWQKAAIAALIAGAGVGAVLPPERLWLRPFPALRCPFWWAWPLAPPPWWRRAPGPTKPDPVPTPIPTCPATPPLFRCFTERPGSPL